MNLWTANLLLYSGELAMLVAAAWLISLAPSLRGAKAAHRHWRLVLLACLALPWIAPRRPLSTGGGSVLLTTGPSTPVPSSSFDLNTLFAAALGLGCLMFLSRLAISFARARRWARRAGTTDSPGIRLSADVKGPVTFGWLRPVILMPAGYPGMPEASRRAIECHERLHVERRDWLHLVMEELVRCALWFHPAVWLVLSRIHLTREQVVDEEAVRRTGDRDGYLAALLAVAGLKTELAFVPAPAFLERRNLARRVAALTRGPLPSNRFAIAFALVALAAASGAAAALLPLRHTAPVTQLRIGGNRQSQKLVFQPRPAYPAEAKAARIQGTVRLAVRIGRDGHVGDIALVGGHPLLVPAAIAAVRQWQYSPTYLNGEPVEVSTAVDVNFTLTR